MRKKRTKINKIIDTYIQQLLNMGVPVKSIVLFGSYARGTYRKDSDIDLIVVSDAFRNMSLRQRQETLGIASARIMKPIEALGYSPEEVINAKPLTILKEALSYGIRLPIN